jgi:hypothetical protein
MTQEQLQLSEAEIIVTVPAICWNVLAHDHEEAGEDMLPAWDRVASAIGRLERFDYLYPVCAL